MAVAWFTFADEAPRVKVAFSGDAGAGFATLTLVKVVVVDDASEDGSA